MDIVYNSLIHVVNQQTFTKCKLNEIPWNNERPCHMPVFRCGGIQQQLSTHGKVQGY